MTPTEWEQLPFPDSREMQLLDFWNLYAHPLLMQYEHMLFTQGLIPQMQHELDLMLHRYFAEGRHIVGYQIKGAKWHAISMDPTVGERCWVTCARIVSSGPCSIDVQWGNPLIQQEWRELDRREREHLEALRASASEEAARRYRVLFRTMAERHAILDAQEWRNHES